MRVPTDFQPLLPSSPVEHLEINTDKRYIIESLLRNATLEAWRWLFSVYSLDDIRTVVTTTKNLRKKDVMLWATYLRIPPQEILCLQTTSQTGPKSSWAY